MNAQDRIGRIAPRRRDVVAGLAALGAGLLVGGAGARAQGGEAKLARIDVHYHIAPPPWIAALAQRNIVQPAWSGWTPAKAVEDMDENGIALSLMSITTPGAGLGEADAQRRLARECNEFAAKMRADHPGRFGMFAVLPMPDVDGSLKEIAYALDTLKADGIGLLTSYGDKWLGNPALAPVLDELNRRKVVVYTHPTAANCCRNLQPGVPPAVVEYGTDTSRAIAELVFSGAATRYADLRIIFSHAGGTVPFLYERFVVQGRNPKVKAILPNGAIEPLRKFYYDTAQAALAEPMAALRKLVPISQILYGSDYPYRTAGEQVKELRDNHVFSARELMAIERGNALRLLPQLKKAA